MDLQTLHKIAVDVACQKSLACVLEHIVQGLAEEAGVALARIWLIKPGDICPTCPRRAECPDQSQCLHLVASDGRSVQADAPAWSRVDGQFRRFPLGVRKVGMIGASAQPILLTDVDQEPSWLADAEWARRENIQSFAGQPLLFKSETLGVLAVFSRDLLPNEAMIVLRTFADHAAAAIANARAYEEIDQLREQLELENEYLRDEVRDVHTIGGLLGGSSALKKVIEQIDLVAPTDSSVLIQGESGTGKELVARAIHEGSSRKDRPLVKVNCASIPRELFESEFFGHVKGAFTGAIRDRVGRFQLADGGSLFLDEVGEIPIDLQSKLLRVLQEGEIERIGEDKTRKVDVRIIAATNRDLVNEIEAKRFRQDLYYRLSVFPIEVVPLRNWREDIPLLADHFLSQAMRRLGISDAKLKQKHIIQLQGYDWPGNIRELQNVIERAAITAREGTLRFDLPEQDTASFEAAHVASQSEMTDDEANEILSYEELNRVERKNLVAALEKTNWKISGSGGAAELLGVKPTTLSSRLKAMGVQRPS